jgi:hypothetical protein
MENLTDTLKGRIHRTDVLVARVDKLVEAGKSPAGWGDPAHSTTPTSIAIHQLSRQIQALQDAVREIALEVQKLSDRGPLDKSGRPLRPTP